MKRDRHEWVDHTYKQKLANKVRENLKKKGEISSSFLLIILYEIHAHLLLLICLSTLLRNLKIFNFWVDFFFFLSWAVTVGWLWISELRYKVAPRWIKVPGRAIPPPSFSGSVPMCRVDRRFHVCPLQFILPDETERTSYGEELFFLY